MKKILNNQKGYIFSFITFLVLVIMLGVTLSACFLVAMEQKNTTQRIKSTQAYYAAEAGIEDALLRLKETPTISFSAYNFSVNNVSVSVNIPNTIGGSKSLTSRATNGGVIRNIQTVTSIDNGYGASFYYGAQAGAGGLQMSNGSRIMGNVFSGGDISGSGIIDNDAIVSGDGHSIQGVTIKGNAQAYSCLSGATINGGLTYVEGGQHTCSHGALTMQSQEISAQPLPIPQSQIDEWKSQAAISQVFSGNKIINGNQTLGPIKIIGTLTISNGATLNMTGIVYVVGNISVSNNATVKLDSSYGSSGGVLISDGTIYMSNNNKFLGSGQVGSYLLVLSTNTADDAISINNNVAGGVFYTSAGGLNISNNVSVVEATGYKVIMQNNSMIQYSSGIVNIYFSSGPGGSWRVNSWQEQ